MRAMRGGFADELTYKGCYGDGEVGGSAAFGSPGECQLVCQGAEIETSELLDGGRVPVRGRPTAFVSVLSPRGLASTITARPWSAHDQ